ncbi:MAG TPA: hypothetical protein VEI73_14940 [Candidatus Acidoferrum sp.]|nr:hypothetical protein [Candidatus Acidoferrum sp.]
MAATGKIRPSWWYAAPGVILIVAGTGLFVYFLLQGFLHVTDGLTQVIVPGKAELSLKTPRIYTIFLEEQTVIDGRIYSTTQSVNGLKCFVTFKAGNEQIPLRHPSMSASYDVNGRSGHSVLEFPIRQSGQYELSCSYPEDTKGPQTVLAVGTGVGEKIIATVWQSLFAFFGGIGGGLLIIVVVYLKREEAKRNRLNSAAIHLRGGA